MIDKQTNKMEHLEHLVSRLDDQFKPTITANEFMEYVKEHKDEIKPFVNEEIWTANNIYEMRISSLLCLAGYYTHDQEELVKFLLREFDGIINVNIDHEHGNYCRDFTDTIMSAPFNHTLELMLADHPEFDINSIIRHSDLFDDTILEKILAKANPHKFEPNRYTLLYASDIAKEYANDPINIHKKLRLRHYPDVDACRVFILALLLENKYLDA